VKILVTAGNTQTPVDQVRCITNVFTGRTGAHVALTAHRRGHRVCLLTSHPEVVEELAGGQPPCESRWRLRVYRTFDDLHRLMAEEVRQSGFDAVIHAAAVSDYSLAGVFTPAPGTTFDPSASAWKSEEQEPGLRAAGAGKVKSSHPELWLRLVPTPKLVDEIRAAWGFGGVLVKFKLEVGVAEADLLAIADAARRQSRADLVVANTLEGMSSWARIGRVGGQFEKVARAELSARLLESVEELTRGRLWAPRAG
jgi:phosphopantothenate-cysteine ligase/phosphopantothenoylcysteine decarboxylase/phosphopantothenate--cysteine ligase